MPLKESGCLCACWLYAAFFSMFAALFIWEAGRHGNSMCAVSVQGTPPPLVFTQRHLLLWDLTGQKHEMQMVLTELPIIINPWFVTQLLMGLTEKAIKYLNQGCNASAALWAWLGADYCGLSSVWILAMLNARTAVSVKEWEGQGLRWRGVVLLQFPFPTPLPLIIVWSSFVLYLKVQKAD